MLQRLPKTLAADWPEQPSSANSTFRALKEFLRVKVQAMELSSMLKKDLHGNTKPSGKKSNALMTTPDGGASSTAGAFLLINDNPDPDPPKNNNGERYQQQKRKCLFDGEDHTATICPVPENGARHQGGKVRQLLGAAQNCRVST